MVSEALQVVLAFEWCGLLLAVSRWGLRLVNTDAVAGANLLRRKHRELKRRGSCCLSINRQLSDTVSWLPSRSYNRAEIKLNMLGLPLFVLEEC